MNFDILVSEESITKTSKGLQDRKYGVTVVEDGGAALAKIKEFIPQGSSVQSGSSRTLEEIGYIDYLKAGQHGWNNLKENILLEKDPSRQAQLRREATLSDYYLGSVHALVENGQFVIASNTGSQLPNIVYTSPNLIFVVSTKKIVPTFEDAMKRLYEHVVPLEDKRLMDSAGVHTMVNKVLTFNGEPPSSIRKINFILVKENLGF